MKDQARPQVAMTRTEGRIGQPAAPSFCAYTKQQTRGLGLSRPRGPPSLPGARHDDPQVAVTRHCRRHFSPAEQKHHPLQTTSSHNVFLPWYQKEPCTSSSSLLPAQWPWSWKPKGEGLGPRGGLPSSPSPAISTGPLRGSILECSCPVPWTWAKRREGDSTTQN